MLVNKRLEKHTRSIYFGKNAYEITFYNFASNFNVYSLDPTVIVPPPRGIVAFNATATSMCLKWEPPQLSAFITTGEVAPPTFWYTLSYKTRTPQTRDDRTVIDYLSRERFEVTGLRSFTLYEFSLVMNYCL